ncbi:hypothetical protein MRX96_017309 [Rhipicephalus microplus]
MSSYRKPPVNNEACIEGEEQKAGVSKGPQRSRISEPFHPKPGCRSLEDLPLNRPLEEPKDDLPLNLPLGRPREDLPLNSPQGQPEDVPLNPPSRRPKEDLPLNHPLGQPNEDVPLNSPSRRPKEDLPLNQPLGEPKDDLPLNLPLGRPMEDLPMNSPQGQPEDVPLNPQPVLETTAPLELFQEAFAVLNDFCGNLCIKIPCGRQHEYPFYRRAVCNTDTDDLLWTFVTVVRLTEDMVSVVERFGCSRVDVVGFAEALIVALIEILEKLRHEVIRSDGGRFHCKAALEHATEEESVDRALQQLAALQADSITRREHQRRDIRLP